MKRHQITPICTVELVGLVMLSTLFASTSILAQEIIVDNRDANTSQNGNWHSSSGPNPYSIDSVYNNTGGLFTWYPVLPEPGDYDVYAWWTYHSKRSSSVPYRVRHDGPTATIYVDQQDPELGGQWNLLGRYTYTEGITPEISVSSENGLANADAVRFVLRGAPGPYLKVIEVKKQYTHSLGGHTVTGLEAVCPDGTLLTGGGVRKFSFSSPTPPTTTFDYFVGSYGFENMWIGSFHNPSNSPIALDVEVTAFCASIETH